MIPLLRVDALTIEAKTLKKMIVHPITFELKAGEPLILVGETGSGKSLIANAILGNLSEDLKATGKIFIEGVEFLSQPKTQRQKLWGKKLGLLPQEPWLSLDPTMTSLPQVAEVYTFVRKKKKQDAKQSAYNDFEQFDLHEAAKKFPHQLSGGMAQRVAFCCAMAGGAEVLIIDEPTKGLDTVRKYEVIGQLRKFLKNKGRLLVITHDVEVAQQLGGWTIVLKDGVVQESNATVKLFLKPEKSYTRKLIGAAPHNWQKPYPSQRSGKRVVECKNVSKTFSGRSLFTGVNLSISQGEVVGLYGPSGSGKSTLGNILLGLIQPDEGKIVKMNGYQPFQFLKLYQDPPAAFSPYHTLQNSMDDVMNLHKLQRDRFDQLLSKLNLDPSLLERNPQNISGGELQRLAIIRALLLKPVFLFADEPTSRLDPISQKETMHLICEIVRENQCGMLLVSHDRKVIDKTCDLVIEIDKRYAGT